MPIEFSGCAFNGSAVSKRASIESFVHQRRRKGLVAVAWKAVWLGTHGQERRSDEQYFTPGLIRPYVPFFRSDAEMIRTQPGYRHKVAQIQEALARGDARAHEAVAGVRGWCAKSGSHLGKTRWSFRPRDHRLRRGPRALPDVDARGFPGWNEGTTPATVAASAGNLAKPFSHGSGQHHGDTGERLRVREWIADFGGNLPASHNASNAVSQTATSSGFKMGRT